MNSNETPEPVTELADLLHMVDGNRNPASVAVKMAEMLIAAGWTPPDEALDEASYEASETLLVDLLGRSERRRRLLHRNIRESRS